MTIRREVPRSETAKLACRRCGGWGTILLGNRDRETCDLCNGSGAEPVNADGEDAMRENVFKT